MSSGVGRNSGCWLPTYDIIGSIIIEFQVLADSANRLALSYFSSEVDPKVNFYQAVKNFSEDEIVEYVRSGHRPPPGQAFKIRKKSIIQTDELERSSQLERSIVVLASGTVFRTGKSKDVVGNVSVPGGNKSKLLGEGKRKRAFLVEDLNTNRKVAITVSKQKINPCLEEMKKEAFITSRIPSFHVLHSRFYARTTQYLGAKIKAGYLESEVCDGGTLEDRPELAQDPAIREQIIKAVADTHRAGFVHLDIHQGNIAFVRVGSDELSVRLLDFGNAEPLAPSDIQHGQGKMEDLDTFRLKEILVDDTP